MKANSRAPECRPLQGDQEYPEPEMADRAPGFLALMRRRRRLRDYDGLPCPRPGIEAALAGN